MESHRIEIDLTEQPRAQPVQLRPQELRSQRFPVTFKCQMTSIPSKVRFSTFSRKFSKIKPFRRILIFLWPPVHHLPRIEWFLLVPKRSLHWQQKTVLWKVQQSRGPPRRIWHTKWNWLLVAQEQLGLVRWFSARETLNNFCIFLKEHGSVRMDTSSWDATFNFAEFHVTQASLTWPTNRWTTNQLY